MLDVKLKFWFLPRGSVCLMIVILPQFWILIAWNSRSCGLELKLDADERDSHTCCGKEKHLPVRPSTFVRLTPISLKAKVGSSVPLIPFSFAGIASLALTAPSNAELSGAITFAPQP